MSSTPETLDTPTHAQLTAPPDVFGEVEFVDLPALATKGLQMCLMCSTPVYTDYSFGDRHKAWHAALADALGGGA